MSVAFELFYVNAERALMSRDFYIKCTQSFFLWRVVVGQGNRSEFSISKNFLGYDFVGFQKC